MEELYGGKRKDSAIKPSSDDFISSLPKEQNPEGKTQSLKKITSSFTPDISVSQSTLSAKWVNKNWQTASSCILLFGQKKRLAIMFRHSQE